MNCAGMLARVSSVTLVALLVLAGASRAQALHVDTKLGFQFKPPRDYKSVALNPQERTVVAKYQADAQDQSGDAGGARFSRILELQFYPPERFKEQAGDDDGPAATGLDAYQAMLDDRHTNLSVTDVRELSISGAKAREVRYSSAGEPLSVYCMILEEDDGVFVFEGAALTQRFKDATSEFSKAAKSFKRVARADRTQRDAELAEMSDQERFLQQQIDKLPPGWSSLRTARYLFLYNAEKSFVQELADQVEAMRDEYERLYPPDHPLAAVSIVRVCNSFDEFHAYSGAPEGVGGYWASGLQELVFYDKRPRDETLCVARHEAFHQYIFYFYGELSPHSWYNEGHGDYFSGARLTKTNRITDYGKAPGGYNRAELVKEMARKTRQGVSVSDGALAPLKQLLKFHQPEYYDKKGGALPVAYYPEGWAVVHMLREAKGLDARWKRILPDYLARLLEARHQIATEIMEKKIKQWEQQKAEFDAGGPDAPAELPPEPSRNPEDYYTEASQVKEDEVQDLAYKKTFGDWTAEDWKKFEEFFLEYVEKL